MTKLDFKSERVIKARIEDVQESSLTSWVDSPRTSLSGSTLCLSAKAKRNEDPFG